MLFYFHCSLQLLFLWSMLVELSYRMYCECMGYLSVFWVRGWSFWKKKKARWIHLLIMISDSGLCYIIEYGRSSWILDCRNGMSLLWIGTQRYLAILENLQSLFIYIWIRTMFHPSADTRVMTRSHLLTDSERQPQEFMRKPFNEYLLKRSHQISISKRGVLLHQRIDQTAYNVDRLIKRYSGL